jgi:hypothetical protein
MEHVKLGARFGGAPVVVALLLVMAACGGAQTPEAVDGETATDPPGRAVGEPPWKGVEVGWTRLAAPPFVRAGAASVWTGEKLVYWGGDSGYGATQHADGAAYDPVGGSWERIPSGPLSGRSTPGAVWTGTEVVLWGGWPSRGDGAAFDPKLGTWRTLPAAPLSPRVPVGAVWTGKEIVVWGDASRQSEATDGAAYDPEADRWRALPPAPLALNAAHAVWTGKEMVVYGALLDRNNRSATKHAQGIAYNPKHDEWRVIAPHPLSPQASSAAWIGDRMLVWDYGLTAGAYDSARDAWKRVPDLPLPFAECYPESALAQERLLAWYCGRGAMYEIPSGTWQRIPPPEGEVFGQPVSAGSVILFAGAAHEGHANALWALTPRHGAIRRATWHRRAQQGAAR